MQPEFVLAFLKKCHRAGMHTTIETCGYAKWKKIEEILRYLDLIYLDIKCIDPIEHRKLTGVSNDLILENAKKIAHNSAMIIRIPIIPGYTDSEDNIRSTAIFAAELGSIRNIELLPYHRLGEHKYSWLKREYKLRHIQPPSREHMRRLKEIIEACGSKVVIGGQGDRNSLSEPSSSEKLKDGFTIA